MKRETERDESVKRTEYISEGNEGNKPPDQPADIAIARLRTQTRNSPGNRYNTLNVYKTFLHYSTFFILHYITYIHLHHILHYIYITFILTFLCNTSLATIYIL